MKSLTVEPSKWWAPLILMAVFCLGAGAAWASDAAPGAGDQYSTALSRLLGYMQANFTRANWDYLMRWVNFAILAGLIIKFARVPLANFLKDKQAETARALQRFEAQKLAAEEKIREGQIRLDASKERLALIQDRIVGEGKRRKELMILEAKEESRQMLSATRARLDNQIHEVARTIRNEMIDAAYEKAMQKLPAMVTSADHQRLVNQWVDETAI